MSCQCFDAVDCWLFLEYWVNVVSVKIISEDIHTEVSFEDAIHVDHRHNHEHEHLSEKVGSEVFFIS